MRMASTCFDRSSTYECPRLRTTTERRPFVRRAVPCLAAGVCAALDSRGAAAWLAVAFAHAAQSRSMTVATFLCVTLNPLHRSESMQARRESSFFTGRTSSVLSSREADGVFSRGDGVEAVILGDGLVDPEVRVRSQM